MALKHVGRIKNNRAKVVVAYRTIPNDAYSCLVVPTAELASDEHDTLIKAVESAAGQEAGELYEVMQRTTLPDGRNMLKGFHQRGNLRKFPTSEIEMTPKTNTAILLSDLNGVIAEQKGIAVALHQKVIPKERWDRTNLKEEDKITIITATQGG